MVKCCFLQVQGTSDRSSQPVTPALWGLNPNHIFTSYFAWQNYHLPFTTHVNNTFRTKCNLQRFYPTPTTTPNHHSPASCGPHHHGTKRWLWEIHLGWIQPNFPLTTDQMGFFPHGCTNSRPSAKNTQKGHLCIYPWAAQPREHGQLQQLLQQH